MERDRLWPPALARTRDAVVPAPAWRFMGIMVRFVAGWSAECVTHILHDVLGRIARAGVDRPPIVSVMLLTSDTGMKMTTAATAHRTMLKRGAVTATLDPLEACWNGERVPLSPLEAALLVNLLRRSRLRWDEVADVLKAGGGGADSRDVLIHRIRRKFAELGAGDPIETLRGWGIRFRTEADDTGSLALWIGATDEVGPRHRRRP